MYQVELAMTNDTEGSGSGFWDPTTTFPVYNISNLSSDNSSNISYDGPIASAETSLFSLILGVWITGIFCLLGFTGNILSFIVLLRAFGSSPMFYVLRAVAISDALFLFCVFFVQTVLNMYPTFDFFKWFFVYRAYIQHYMWPIMMMTQMSTVWLTVLVSLERWVAICYPLRAASICTLSHVRKAVFCVFIVSILYNVPRYFEVHVEGNVLNKTDLGENMLYRVMYTCIMYMICLYVAPLMLLMLLNLKLVLALHEGKRQWQTLQFRQKKEQNLTVIPLTIVLVFFFCGTPALTVNVIESLRPKLFELERYINFMLVGNFLVVLNSASNFVIYCLLGKKFRSRLLELCHCTCCRSNYRAVHQLVNQTQISDF